MANYYMTVPTLRSRLGISGTASDTQIAESIERASRYVDSLTKRYFYTETATRYIDTGESAASLLLLADLLVATTVTTDSELDGTYDGETWTENNDFWLWPSNSWPKNALEITGFGSYGIAKNARRYIKIVGTWGYGDGESSSPWTATAITGTVATTTGTTLTLSADGTIERGHTIKIGTEQMFVSATATGNATVTRGVNGTTAAAHSTAIISTANYPALIVGACQAFGITAFRKIGGEEFESEGIGDYRYKRFSASNQEMRDRRLVSSFVHSVIP